ncbi:MAG: F0F1 ATP synthase subunit B [Candidatus Pacebacteria bacterium]|nr:F0F1 ATP synthase subunit B [Candidatus Paceibacterota bacterium]
MESLIETFHLDVKLIIAQAVNFAIVAFILYFFALKPIFKVMDERSNKIEKGVENAEKAKQILAEAEEEKEEILNKAREKANEKITEGRERGEQKKQFIVDQTKKEVSGIMEQEKKKLEEERKKMITEIKQHTAELLNEAVTKIMGQKLDDNYDAEIIKKFAEDLDKRS